MDYREIFDKRQKFENSSEVINTTEEVKEKRTYIEDEDVTLNNDKTKKTVEREVEGKLAEDVRKRVGAAPDEPVLVTEVEELFWLSELTAEMDYRTIIKCGKVEKLFNSYSAHQNFAMLLEWIDEDPSIPVDKPVDDD